MDKIRISFTGDILVYQCQNKFSRVGKDSYDYSDYLKDCKPLFQKSDYVVGSLETPLAGKKAGYTKEDTNFNTPDGILNALKSLGVDMLTTGNNHALDRGIQGLIRTVKILDERNFDHTGTSISYKGKRYIVKNIGDLKVAFLSYTYGTNSTENECMLKDEEYYMVNLTRKQDAIPYRSLPKRIVRSIFMAMPVGIRKKLKPEPPAGIVADCVNKSEIDSERNRVQHQEMLSQIQSAKRDADVVIFCLHSGGQFNSEVSGYTKWLIDTIVDVGVNAVVCNHPHTVLPIEKRANGCVVAYSLGNFSFTPGVGYYVDGVGAEYSTILHLDINKNNKTIDYEVDYTKCVINTNGSTVVKPISADLFYKAQSHSCDNEKQ